MSLIEFKHLCNCLRCGHRWNPKNVDLVVVKGKNCVDIRICPKCKSAYWDKPKEKTISSKYEGLNMRSGNNPIKNDFKEFIEILNKHRVDYCITGAYAVSFHSEPRSTGDIDFYIAHTKDNSKKVATAIKEFYGEDIDNKFFDTKETVLLRMGYEPNMIELCNGLTGLSEDEIMKHRVKGHYGDIITYYIGLDALIKNKGLVKEKDYRGHKKASDSRDYQVLNIARKRKKGRGKEL